MKKVVIFLFISATLITFIWFKEKLILGVAEDGLVFHNISNYYHQTEYTWMKYPGLGSPSLALVAGKPTFFTLTLLQDIGIPGFLIQAGLIWILLITTSISMYLLVKELFPKLPPKYALLSAGFYWFNPITLSGVWNRFLSNYLFFFALLPLGTYLYIKGLKKGKYIWVLILNAALIFFSYAFSYVAFSVLFWIWLVLITINFIVFYKDRRSRLFALKYFLLSLLVFIFVNIWWILPMVFLAISGGASPTTNLFLTQNNTGLLDALSKSLGNMNDIFKLTNASFISADSLNWVKVYFSPLLFIIQFFFVGVILFFIINARNNPSVLLLASLFFIVIFLSKGNNPPFGEIYNFVFKNVTLLQIFRNPFEKFGFLLSLISALLLGPSINELINNTKNKFGKLLYPLFFIIIFLYLGFPVYSTLALTNKFIPANDYSIGYKVKVPDYYKEVNKSLESQGDNFRYLGFPIKDEGVTYNWEKGYAGVELAVALYDSKGIFHNTSTPFFNKIVPRIEETLLSDKDFSSLASFVNARFYILRNDIDYKLRNMTDPGKIKEKLEERERRGEVKKIGDFGKVSIWENLNWKDTTFYSANKFIKVDSFDEDINFIETKVLNNEALIDKSSFAIIEKSNISAENSLSVINYKKINATKYILSLKNVQEPFLLVFSELYNDGWNATYGDGQSPNPHIRVNVFANSWIINKRGDFEIMVEFMPQRWMDFGEKVSIGGYVLIIFMLIFLISKYRRSRV